MDRRERELQTARVLERVAYALVGALAIVFAIILTVSLCSRSVVPQDSSSKSDSNDSESVDEAVFPPDVVQKSFGETKSDSIDDDDHDDYYFSDGASDEEDYDETYEEYEEDYERYDLDVAYDEFEDSIDEADSEEGEYSDEFADEEIEDARTIIVPKDFKTLAEALDFIGEKGCILLQKSSKPYEVGQTRFFEDRPGCVAQGSVTIRGETKNPADTTIVISCNQSFFVDNSDVSPALLENLTIRNEVDRKTKDVARPSVTVVKGDVEIRNCVFLGERSSALIGLSTIDASSSAKVVDSTFSSFGGCGVCVGESSVVSVIRCRFDKRNRCGLYVNHNGRINASECVFRQNNLAFYGSFGTSGFVNDCEFVKNRENWRFEDDLQHLNITRLRNIE